MPRIVRSPRSPRPPSGVNSVARLIPRMLLDMQNRGQLAAGMTSYRPDRNALLKTHKEVGTVAEAFRLNHREEFEAIMGGVDGPAAIGHVRYATCGGNDRCDAQPFERDHRRKAKWFAFAFNGQLANYLDLKDELLSQGRLPPEARYGYRNHHALAGLRAPGGRPGARLGGGVRPDRGAVRRRVQPRADHRRMASWSWSGTRWVSGR